ncbi:MAG: hypothetical protein OHK0056_13540 [Bacteriovoracaceae bacterium]
MSGLRLKIGELDSSQAKTKGNESDFDQKLDDILGIKNSDDSNGHSSVRPKLKLIQEDETESTDGESLIVKKKRVNRYFYKVTNHHELFKIGRSFYKDYLSGVKSFAITSTGYQSSQQNSILGLASFFDHKEEGLKIAIISDNLYLGAFKDIVSISQKHFLPILKDGKDCEVIGFYGHFDFIDLSQLLDYANDCETEAYDEIFDSIVDHYDIVFWDVPELHKIQRNSEKYFPVIMKFESLSIIVAQSLSSAKDIEEIKYFFLGYGINLKGLLLDTVQAKTESKVKTEKAAPNSNGAKRPWWRIFG